MAKRVRMAVWALTALVIVLGLLEWLLLAVAFDNRGQEFGAYGQYNRLLRVVRTTGEYQIVSHRVRRKLQLTHLFHVEEFSVRLRDKADRVAEIRFEKGTAEMDETDDAALHTIVTAKFERALRQLAPSP